MVAALGLALHKRRRVGKGRNDVVRGLIVGRVLEPLARLLGGTQLGPICCCAALLQEGSWVEREGWFHFQLVRSKLGQITYELFQINHVLRGTRVVRCEKWHVLGRYAFERRDVEERWTKLWDVHQTVNARCKPLKFIKKVNSVLFGQNDRIKTR